MRETIKLINAALDEVPGGEIILRGVLDPDSYQFLKTADYQREVLPKAHITSLMDAIKTTSVPDVDLGMRGGGFVERKDEAGRPAFYLQDDVYIIDGLQRITAGAELLRRDNHRAHLGAVVHFNTDEKMERSRFRMLNTSRVRLSSNILLRNYRTDYPVMEMLYNLCYDKTFVLYDRVSWGQRQTRSQLITATTLSKTVGYLHAGFGPSGSGDMLARMGGFQKTMNNVGRNTMRENVKTFFNLVDECWHMRSITFKEHATILRGTFLNVFAKMLANHQNFWTGNKLVISSNLRHKIALFPVDDREVAHLASVQGKARDLLYQLMVDHVNSGKRTHRLLPFKRMVATESEAVSINTVVQ